jgi:hypothetical protein
MDPTGAGAIAAAFAAAWSAITPRDDRPPRSGPLVKALRTPMRLAENLVASGEGPALADTLYDAVCRVHDALRQVDDSSGALNDTGRELASLLGRAWADLPADRRADLPDRVCAMLPRSNDFMLQELVTEAAAGLGPDGLRRVRTHIERRLAEIGPVDLDGPTTRLWGEKVVLTEQLKLAMLALDEIDDYLALEDATAKHPGYHVLEIARNLMEAGHVAEALARIETALDARAIPGSGDACPPHEVPELLHRRTECHEWLGNHEAAVASDWAAYRESLDERPLSSLLARVARQAQPAILAEAVSIAIGHPDAAAAVRRLADLGAIDAAAERLRPDVDTIARDAWWEVQEVPALIGAEYPELAWRMHQAQLRSLLDPTRPSAYRAAAWHLLECRRLAAAHAEIAEMADGQRELEAFMQTKHGQKRTFWEMVAAEEAEEDR